MFYTKKYTYLCESAIKRGIPSTDSLPKTLNTYCSCTVLVPTYDIYTVVITQEKVPGGGGVVKISPHKNFVSFVSFLYFFRKSCRYCFASYLQFGFSPFSSKYFSICEFK